MSKPGAHTQKRTQTHTHTREALKVPPSRIRSTLDGRRRRVASQPYPMASCWLNNAKARGMADVGLAMCEWCVRTSLLRFVLQRQRVECHSVLVGWQNSRETGGCENGSLVHIERMHVSFGWQQQDGLRRVVAIFRLCVCVY